MCEPRFGVGIASRYDGQWAAMNFCSWEVRHRMGCGFVRITSLDTHRSVIAKVGEWCHCYVEAPGPNGETARLIDLTRALVASLGLDWDRGLYRVRVELVPALATATGGVLPDTAMEAP